MKTKFNIKFISIIIMMMMIVSCNKDFLDLNPISSYNAGSFYKTQTDIELAIIGCYSQIEYLTNQTTEAVLESRSDNITYSNSYTYSEARIHTFVEGTSNEWVVPMWQAYWSTIDRCNAVLDRIDNVTFSDENRHSNLKGEAYFLRGYAYFQLGWLYGGVPKIDHQMTIDEIKKIPRSSQNETFSFAATDLTQAALLLPDVWETKEVGKATKYAAKGILARMYMFQKKYSDAKILLSEIIGSGKYAMADKFADCFSDLYDNSPEHVFQIQYKSGNVGQGNNYVAHEIPEDIRTDMFPTGGDSRALLVSSDLYNKYERGDLRRDFTILTSMSPLRKWPYWYQKFAHASKRPVDKSDFEVNMPILRYTDVKMMYAEILNEEGYNSNGEAFAILNQVRTRAGLSPLTSVQVPTQESYRQAMLDERRLEFAAEFLRWFDLVRAGKAMSVMNAFFQKPEEHIDGIYQMKEYQIIFAIPNDELLLNTDPTIMWQNPGY